MGSFAVILPAAGRSTRFGNPTKKKIYADLEGRAVWLRAVDSFLNRDDVSRIVLAIHPEDRELFASRYAASAGFLGITVIDGGEERHDTVSRALGAIADCDAEFVAVHDAARPCLSREIVDRVFAAAREFGAAVPGVAVSDTLKRVDDEGRIVATVARAGLVAVQTPQAFRRELLERAHANRDQVPGITDDAMLVESLGHPVRVVEGSPLNLKITTAIDMKLASAILIASQPPPKEVARRPFDDEIDFR